MRRLRPLAALVALALVACAPEGGSPSAADPEPQPARIEVVGAADASVEAGSALELTFRYLGADGLAVEDGLVDLALVGEPAGASLSALGAATDADGLARVTVRSGDEASFDVTADAPDAVGARVRVTVRPMVFGTLGVEVTYGGARPMRHAELGLFANASCEDLADAVPSPRATGRLALGGATEIGELPLDVPMALYVLGIDAADRVAAETCTNVTMVDERHDVRVTLADTAVALGGPYATVERFDVTDGFGSELDTVLEVAAGLSGEDRARWLVDQVADASRTPSWLRTALSSAFARDLVAGLLDDAMAGLHTPSELAELGRFGADVDAAFAGLTLDGELTFDRPDEWGVAMGTHRIDAVRLPLADGTEATVPEDASAEVVVTFGDRIDVDEHALPIPFGELAEAVIYVAGLRRMSGGHDSFGAMIGSYFDCAAIAARLGTGTYASLAESACTVGVSMLATRVNDALAALWAYDTLHLSGSADLRDEDADYDLERIADGEAHARWVGDSGELAFDGTFEGRSVDDGERTHRVRERLVGLE